LYGSFLGSDHAEKTAEFKKENPELETASFERCARLADLAVLCLKSTAAEKVVGQVKAELSGKTVIDATTTLLPTRLHKTGC
jgi:predicted dinucleotide-binding enzyme